MSSRHAAGKVAGVRQMDAFTIAPEDVCIIGVDTKDGPEHPLWDKRIYSPLTEELVLNYMTFGRRQPITVRRRRNDDETDTFECVTGRHGVRYLREANKRLVAAGGKPMRIKCVIDEQQEAGQYASLVMMENLARTEASAMDSAEYAQRLQGAYGYSVDEIAIACGKTKQTVESWLSLVRLDETVKQKVKTGRITASAAAGLTRLTPVKQREKMEKLEAATKPGKAVSVRAVRAEVSGAGEAGHPAPTKREVRALLGSRQSSRIPRAALDALEWMMGDRPAPEWAVLVAVEPSAKAADPQLIFTDLAG